MYWLKVDFMDAKFNMPHASGQPPPLPQELPIALGIQLKSLWLNDCTGGSLIVNKYVYIDGILQSGYPKDVTLVTTSDGVSLYDNEEIDKVLPKCLHTVTVAVHVKGPPMLDPEHPNPWISQWINVTMRFWITVQEDIGGTTFYDIIGLPTYPYKSEVPAPDCKVDIKDILTAAKAFGAKPGDITWNSIADVNKDYKVDIKDILLEAKAFGAI
jgi:hypothetical protein